MTAAGLHVRARQLLEQGNTLSALAMFEKIPEPERSAAVLSGYAVCIAAERGQIEEGIRLCRDAIRQNGSDPFHYLNLGRIYLKAGQKNDALLAWREGMAATRSEELRTMLETLGTRRPPLFPSLPRRHILNRWLGLLLSKFGIR